jgi:putative NIF3 family GTP cyclohydrolase 1 type 2
VTDDRVADVVTATRGAAASISLRSAGRQTAPHDVIERQSLLTYLDEYLSPTEGEDFCPNGLQVEGASEIHRLVTGVSACQELFEVAARRDAQGVLVHHGILWHHDPLPLVGVQYRRIAVLIRHQINLLSYHLPLDRHPEVGNNAVAARRLGLEGLAPFGDYSGSSLGFRGALSLWAVGLAIALCWIASVPAVEKPLLRPKNHKLVGKQNPRLQNLKRQQNRQHL